MARVLVVGPGGTIAVAGDGDHVAPRPAAAPPAAAPGLAAASEPAGDLSP